MSSARSFEQLSAAKEILICCGPGGVGKTTTAAALAAMSAARQGSRVLVLTIDPARRLANAMGLHDLGNEESRVAPELLEAAGITVRGELWAAMLDTKSSWDDLIRQHAPDKATAEKILANPIYRNVTAKFVQSHDYIAMERLYELHKEGEYDLIVLDTPPTRNAIDFLDAPERMADFFSSRLLRLLTSTSRSRIASFAYRPFYQIADRILGKQFLGSVIEFFAMFQSMHAGFVNRANAVSALLRDRRTGFVVVTTPDSAPVGEAEFFVNVLHERDMELVAIVVNKALPPYLLSDRAAQAAERLASQAPLVADKVSESADTPVVCHVLTELADNFMRLRTVAARQAEQRARLASAGTLVATTPYFPGDVHDLAGVVRMGEQLWS